MTFERLALELPPPAVRELVVGYMGGSEEWLLDMLEEKVGVRPLGGQFNVVGVGEGASKAALLLGLCSYKNEW